MLELVDGEAHLLHLRAVVACSAEVLCRVVPFLELLESVTGLAHLLGRDVRLAQVGGHKDALEVAERVAALAHLARAELVFEELLCAQSDLAKLLGDEAALFELDRAEAYRAQIARVETAYTKFPGGEACA